MDLKQRLELGHSKVHTDEIVDYVSGNPTRFKQLVEVYVKGPFRITQRAAWPLSICVEKWPYLAEPHLKTLLNILHKPGIHHALKRNTMRLLQFIEIPKRYHGKIADLCFAYLQDRQVPVAIRVFSMTVLSDIAKAHPEMKRELKLILEDELPFGTAAFRVRGLKVLKHLMA